jgi:hypothetical protein
MYRMLVSALVVFVLGACAIPSYENGYRHASPVQARTLVDQVVNPADVPPLFSDCTFDHRADGRSINSDEGTFYSVINQNRRECLSIRWQRGQTYPGTTVIPPMVAPLSNNSSTDVPLAAPTSANMPVVGSASQSHRRHDRFSGQHRVAERTVLTYPPIMYGR